MTSGIIICQRCTKCWFDIDARCGRFAVGVINTPITSHIYLPLLWHEHLRCILPAKFNQTGRRYERVSMYVSSSDLMHLVTESSYLLPTSHQPPNPGPWPPPLCSVSTSLSLSDPNRSGSTQCLVLLPQGTSSFTAIPTKTPVAFFTQTEKTIRRCMKPPTTPESRSSLEEGGWGHRPPIQALGQSCGDQNRTALSEEQTRRSMEQNRKPRRKPARMRPMDL